MKIFVGVSLAASVFVLVMPLTASFAQDSKTTVIVPPLVPTPPDASPETIEANKLVCHKPRPLIGTHFTGPSICKTQGEWDAEMQRTQHNIAKWQIKGCLPNGTCPQ